MGRKTRNINTNQNRQQPTTPQTNTQNIAAIAVTPQNVSTVNAQPQDIHKLQNKINELEFQLEEEKEITAAKEAEIATREQELAQQKVQAINGFKELEAMARQEWITEKKQEIIVERQQIIEAAQTEVNKNLSAAQTEAQKIIKEAQKLKLDVQNQADSIIEQAETLANEHRQRAREQIIKEIQTKEEELVNFRKVLDDKDRYLEEEDKKLSRQIKQIERREEDLEEENNWLALQKKKLQHKEQELTQRENACSEEAINRLIKEREYIEQQLQLIQDENHRLRVELESNKNMLLNISGSPAKILQDNKLLENKLREYEKLFEQYPSEIELAELRRRAEAAIDFEAKYRDLQARVDDLERIRRQQHSERMETEQLRKERDTLKLLNQYLSEQIEELKRMLGQLQTSQIQAFSNFASMDRENENISERPHGVAVNNLNELATISRAWMGSLPSRQELEMGEAETSHFAHYYDKHTIRAFIASMAASRLIIIQGQSGTGKTSLPEYFAYAIGGKFARIEVQSSWRDKLDLLGSYNSFFRVFNESQFSRAIYEAGTTRYCNHPYFIVLDEMNLSRVEYYFADLLSIMEGRPEDREIELLNHDPTGGQLPKGIRLKNGAVQLPIPDNVWFVGTANTDESTYEITRKVYDRAQVLQIDEPFPQESFDTTQPANLKIPDFRQAVQKAIANFRDTDREAVEGCLKLISSALHEYFQVGYGQRLLDQLSIFLPTYTATGGKLGEGLDHFIARKLLWQVQNRTDPNVRSGLQEVRDIIEVSFTDNLRLGSAAISLKLLEREINKFKR
ncbi:AAA family ATPase [Nostoc sp.]